MVVCKKCITFAHNFKICAVLMEKFSSFNALIQEAIVKNWDQDALTYIYYLKTAVWLRVIR